MDIVGRAMQEVSSSIALWNGWLAFAIIGGALIVAVALYDITHRG